MINSVWGLAASNPFDHGEYLGSVFGDLFINPSELPNSTNTSNTSTDVTVNSNPNNAINNTINLGANTADALVQLTTKAGNATSGDATVMANVMNLMNTVSALVSRFWGW